MKNIRERAVLVQFKDHVWVGSKLDKSVSQDVASRSKAESSKVGFYKKHLIPRAALKGRFRVSNETRAFHYRNTLPWMEDGMRILPAKNIKPYMEQMRKFKIQANEEVEDLISKYDQYVEQAKRMLGTMFNKGDYPDKETIRAKFGFDVVVLPIPEVKDWRVDINKKEMDELRKQATADLMSIQKQAVLELWERLFDVVNKMEEKLSKDDGIFRDSLVTNIQAMLEVLPALNITDDPGLVKLGKEIQNKLCKTTPAVLRENSTERKKQATEAKKIAKKMEAYMKKGSK